jgi:hypothetical protein
MKDALTGKLASTTLAVASRTAAATGTGVDRQFYNGILGVIICSAFTGGTHTLKFEQSNDNSAWADAPAADLLWDTANTAINTSGQVVFDASGDVGTHIISYLGSAQYVRISRTGTGEGISGASIILEDGRYRGATLLD